MTKQNSTEIIFVVDRSGSMSAIADDMRGGFDAFIAKQKDIPGECKVTLINFDHCYDVVYEALSIHDVKGLVLEPRGGTALLDAVGNAINSTGARLKALPEDERPSQVLFVIITDGYENSSREFTRQGIFEMVTHQRDKYNWEFVFLGANQDAIMVAQNMGISSTNAVTYSSNRIGTSSVMRGLSAGVGAYRVKGRARMDNLYNQAAYDASVDEHDENDKDRSKSSVV